MPREPSEPVAPPFVDFIRQHVDRLNRRFHAMSAELDRIDSNIADLIGDPPKLSASVPTNHRSTNPTHNEQRTYEQR